LDKQNYKCDIFFSFVEFFLSLVATLIVKFMVFYLYSQMHSMQRVGFEHAIFKHHIKNALSNLYSKLLI
jgi:hypothetical protein